MFILNWYITDDFDGSVAGDVESIQVVYEHLKRDDAKTKFRLYRAQEMVSEIQGYSASYGGDVPWFSDADRLKPDHGE